MTAVVTGLTFVGHIVCLRLDGLLVVEEAVGVTLPGEGLQSDPTG